MSWVVMITGASGVLGSALARRLNRDGERLLLLDIDGERLRSLRDELKGDVMIASASVADAIQVDAAVDEVVAGWGRLDAVVHCAGGLLGGVGDVLDFPLEAW